MTKRQAMMAAVAAMVGLMTGKAKSETPASSSSGNAFVIVDMNKPQKVTFDLDAFESFTFTQGDKSVTVTPKELFEALS